LLVAEAYADMALACGRAAVAREQLAAQYARAPAVELLAALARLDGDDASARATRIGQHLTTAPSLAAAEQLLALPPEQWGRDAPAGLRAAVARAARPLQRYRCAACGFEAQHYFWQCPGCLSWDSYPAQRVEAL
jgi:lipopolysaccharide assembly protein B